MYLVTAVNASRASYPQGQNLILNMNDHGFVVTAFNRTVSKVDTFLANEAKGTNVSGQCLSPQFLSFK